MAKMNSMNSRQTLRIRQVGVLRNTAGMLGIAAKRMIILAGKLYSRGPAYIPTPGANPQPAIMINRTFYCSISAWITDL